MELWQRRVTEESFEERRLREMHAYVLENVEEERQRDIQRQRREAKLRLDQIKATVEIDEGIRTRVLKNLEEQTQREIEKQKREDEERRRDIERQRSESRMKLEQMKPTVQFDETIRIREILPELGIERKEDDGF